jgi:hypothetical protein
MNESALSFGRTLTTVQMMQRFANMYGCQNWHPAMICWGLGAARRKAAMSCPQAHSLGSDCLHALHDEVQRLIPTDAAPGIREAIITNLG